MRVDGRRPAVKFLGVGMIDGLRQHARDDAALFGHPKALFGAQGLDPRHGVVFLRFGWTLAGMGGLAQASL
jgi:hypothetical protein